MTMLAEWIAVGVLLLLSALISGTEVAFFSMQARDLEALKQHKGKSAKLALRHLNEPELLLATILIANNFVNVSIVLLAAFASNALLGFGDANVLKFVFEVVIITGLILFFGEILPKVYASQYARRFALFMAFPMQLLIRLLKPFSLLLMRSSNWVNKRMSRHQQNISLDDLSHALELTGSDMKDEKEMLEGIVKFSNLSAQEIMTARVDVIDLDIRSEYTKVLQVIVDSGYSRIPVFDETPDNVKGVLYVKDLLPYLSEPMEFEWNKLLRQAYYVPDTKKINDLLSEFQMQKIHMAIVVDEYGGMAGIVTMEDILEEIVGEISDELDEEESMHTVLADGSYVFEGKVSLNDFFKILSLNPEEFDQVRGDAETLAGLLLELKGMIPQKHEVVEFKHYVFSVLAADNRRIKKVKLTLKP